LLLEHPHVYTFGRQGHAENLLWDEEEREARGVELIYSDRGGDITYHGPGQLVGYPILPLATGRAQMTTSTGEPRTPRLEVVAYVRKLEKTIIKTIASLGIATAQMKGMTGVWVQPEVASRCRHCPPESKKKPSKIASIGIRVDVNGVSQHGFALNVNTDPDYWNGIIGCGLAGYPAVNLADLLWEPPTMETVQNKYIEAFSAVFGYKIEKLETES
jgi:lipoate-protein ligase B